MEEKKSYFKWGEFLSYYKPFRGIFAADMFFAYHVSHSTDREIYYGNCCLSA